MGRELTGKVKVRKGDFNMTAGKDGGKDIATYDYKTVEQHEKEIQELIDQSDIDKENVDPVAELPREEFIRLTQKMFPKWAKDDSKISRFMQNLDPRKIYTESEFREFGNIYGIKNIGPKGIRVYTLVHL